MSISNDALVIAVVVALTFLMWLMLRETFGAKRQLRERLVTFPLYVFLAVWSIGFGYGFWWSLISGEEATRTGLAGLQEDARDASAVVAARLDAVRGQLDSVVSWSDGQMTREETSGGSCGTASGAGRGPLYNARRSVRDSINTLREGMTRSWFEPLQADVEQLRQSAAALGGAPSRSGSGPSRPGHPISAAGRATSPHAATSSASRPPPRCAPSPARWPSPPGAAGFSCYDPTLAERLRQAAAQAEQPAELKLREAVFNEGPAGVANAVKNLWRNIGAYSTSLATYLFSGGRQTVGHTDTGEPITGRDLIALLATIGIDLGLLALAILNPPREAAVDPPVRRARAADQGGDRYRHCPFGRRSRMGAPAFRSSQQGVLSGDPEPLQLPISRTRTRRPGRLAMNQLAGVLSDLELVRWPQAQGAWKAAQGGSRSPARPT